MQYKIKHKIIILLLLFFTCSFFSLETISVSAALGLTEDQSYDDSANDTLPNNYTGKVSVTNDGASIKAEVKNAAKDADKTSLEKTWNTQIEKYKFAIVGITGIATLTMLLVFIKLSIKLAACESHPMLRNQTIKGMCASAVACALLGSVTIYVSLVYHIFY